MEEIEKIDDDLQKWLKEESNIAVQPISEAVVLRLKEIFDAHEDHQRLVDSTKRRSMADPWVIAHALHEGASVVTKETLETHITKRIRIPNVCENMGIPYIDDFEFIRENGIQFF